MLNNASLIDMYREEKAAVADQLNTDNFPSFRDWKAEYMTEWNLSHAGSSFVSFELAQEITDAELNSIHAI